jgi:N-acetyl-gamma-glutamyl-phosphate reductase
MTTDQLGQQQCSQRTTRNSPRRTLRAAVAGASGYAAGELLRLLLGHPKVQIGAVTAGENGDVRLGHYHPQLVPLADRVLAATRSNELVEHDVVFLVLPRGRAAEIAGALGRRVLLIDCNADHRLTDPVVWHRWYGGEHAGAWPYGLPELPGAREKLRGTRRVAVPGSYSVAASIALAPAVAAGLVKPEVVVVAVSGTSGAGRGLDPRLLGSEVMGSVTAYSVGGVHRHTPEISQSLTEAAHRPVSVSLTPAIAPMPRGVLAVCSAPLASDMDGSQARIAYRRAYRGEPFVRLLPEGAWPTTAATLGGNALHLQVTVDEETGRLVAVAAVDNLTKGAAGSAVQCMNLAAGLPETTGLTSVGVAP